MNTTLDIEKMNPTVAELQKMVEQTKDITASDLTDKSQLEIVKKNRIALKNVRVVIEKKGKELRSDALAFQKSVIAKEKELIGIIEPEESRLADIEEQAKKLELMETRKKVLPYRLEKLATIGDSVQATEEELLDMDDEVFFNYYNKRVAEKNDADRLVLQEKERKIKEQEDSITREKELKEAEERGKKEAEERMKRDEEDRKNREVKAEQDRVEKEKKDKEENEKLEDYRNFLISHGYVDNGDFKIEKTEEGYVLYKKLGVFKK